MENNLCNGQLELKLTIAAKAPFSIQGRHFVLLDKMEQGFSVQDWTGIMNPETEDGKMLSKKHNI